VPCRSGRIQPAMECAVQVGPDHRLRERMLRSTAIQPQVHDGVGLSSVQKPTSRPRVADIGVHEAVALVSIHRAVLQIARIGQLSRLTRANRSLQLTSDKCRPMNPAHRNQNLHRGRYLSAFPNRN